MTRFRRTLVAAGVVSVAAFVAVAPTPAQAPKRGGILRVAEQSDPVGFDTLGKKKAPVYTQLALAYTHNRLLKYDPSGEVVNDLAASWSQPNPTTYVVTLRKGVHFHNKPPVNGRELTSEDIKFTFERMAKSPEARLFPTLKAVTTPDKYTVRFELSAPFSSFVANLAATTMYVYAKEAGKPTPDGAGDYTAVDTVIGTGPFMLEEYREKQRLVFKRNPDYFEAGKPYLDGVELYIIADNAGQIAAMRTGKLDLIPAGRGEGLPHFLVPEARSIPGAKVMPHRLFQTSENLVGRVDQKPWSDVRVRRAVSMSIDRAGLAKAMFTEGAELFSGPIPVTSKYFIPLDKLGESAAWYRYDVTAARKLLADAGYPNGLPVKLTTTTGYGPTYTSRTELLKSMLAKLGIEASIVTQEYPVDLQHVQGQLRGHGPHSRLDTGRRGRVAGHLHAGRHAQPAPPRRSQAHRAGQPGAQRTQRGRAGQADRAVRDRLPRSDVPRLPARAADGHGHLEARAGLRAGGARLRLRDRARQHVAGVTVTA